MEVRETPRPFQAVAEGFFPQFEAKLPKRQPVSPEAARLGPLFSGAVEAGEGVEDKAPESPHGPRMVAPAPEVSPVATGFPGDDVKPQAAATANAPRVAAATVRGGLLRGLLWSGALGFRLKPRSARPVIQGELSLATVQVKRNDLLDADLELVWDESAARARSPQVPRWARVRRAGATASGEPSGGGLAGVFFWRRWFESQTRSMR